MWVALVSGNAIPGWASIVLPTYFLRGIELLALGAIGGCLGKLYAETKARPRFFVDQVIGEFGRGSDGADTRGAKINRAISRERFLISRGRCARLHT